MYLFGLFIFLEIKTWQINKAHLSTNSFYFVFMFIKCSDLKQEIFIGFSNFFYKINKILKIKKSK